MPTTAISKPILEAFCREFLLPEPRQEFEFHPSRKWRFDIAWPLHRVALEVEGGVFGRGKPCPCCGRRKAGAHKSTTGLLRDMEKYNEAALMGYVVLRVLPKELYSASTATLVKRAIRTQGRGQP